jgi:ubiquinone/menaquinone biosynthesis C-methylase UbiE
MPYRDRFAGVYDTFMWDTPYEAWADYIEKIIPAGSLVADLACGTGNMTLALAKKGFDMIGVDRSADMLSEAQAKAGLEQASVLWLKQDVRKLDLYGTVDAAVCTCDSFNYLLSEAELFAAFSRCALFLNTGGVFIFDLNTPYKFREVLQKNTFTDAQDGASYVWKNYYDEQTQINEYSMFVTTGEDSFSEIHLQRAYPIETVTTLLTDTGFARIQVNEAYTHDPPKDDSVRVSFVAYRA